MITSLNAGALRVLMTYCPDGEDASQSQKIWAHIKPINQQEKLAADADQNLITHLITIRWIKDFNSNAVLSWGLRMFRICSVFDPDERQFYLILRCEEIST
jgi:SPP1 family predicted phage head-tail adaptor